MPFIVPWQGHKEFKLLKRKTMVSAAGAVGKAAKFEDTGTVIYGMLSQINPTERETYKQNGLEVSHTLVTFGGPQLQQNDYLFMLEGNRMFRVETFHDHGELGHFTAYRLNERKDLQYGSKAVSAADGDQGENRQDYHLGSEDQGG